MGNKTARVSTCILAYLAMGLPALTAAATYVIVDIPGAAATQITAVNTNGDVTGIYTLPSDKHMGFVRTADGTITTFGPPANTSFTDIYTSGINASGAVIGNLANEP